MGNEFLEGFAVGAIANVVILVGLFAVGGALLSNAINANSKRARIYPI